eukprot:10297701-Alexandrium_andersonii.AAC.1
MSASLVGSEMCIRDRCAHPQPRTSVFSATNYKGVAFTRAYLGDWNLGPDRTCRQPNQCTDVW